MKAFDKSPRALARRAGLILLLTEKFGPAKRDQDEHNQTDILTSGLTLLPPSRRARANQWLWEFVTRYSGATVPDSHGVP
jgi:hypothetical protein